MKKILVWTISWIISALILVPCVFLSLIYGFKRDFHFEFHKWWGKEVLDKL